VHLHAEVHILGYYSVIMTALDVHNISAGGMLLKAAVFSGIERAEWKEWQ